MVQIITLELPDDVTCAMREAAQRAGQSLEEWATTELCKHAPTAEQRDAAMARLLQHTVYAPEAVGSDNESIDRDLAREYGCRHEDN